MYGTSIFDYFLRFFTKKIELTKQQVKTLAKELAGPVFVDRRTKVKWRIRYVLQSKKNNKYKQIENKSNRMYQF